MSTLRRFIAGAICPACHQVDKIFVREEQDQRICECVRCGHREVIERHEDAEAGAVTRDPVRIIERDAD